MEQAPRELYLSFLQQEPVLRGDWEGIKIKGGRRHSCYLPLGHMSVLGKCFEVRKREPLGEVRAPYKEGQLAKRSSKAFSPNS